ncbi:MAG TPA: hypothetical protein VJ941_12365 [Gracilimonas sp.]|nr:hypothetical protein [Gracilimonas sp.]
MSITPGVIQRKNRPNTNAKMEFLSFFQKLGATFIFDSSTSIKYYGFD